MKNIFLSFTTALVLLVTSLAQATICPDPNNSSLQEGVIPPPWELNPFSANRPYGEEGTHFVRANILVAGSYGRGVVCTYLNSVGFYSIWWPVTSKIPPRSDNNWRDTLGGYECTTSLTGCVFYP